MLKKLISALLLSALSGTAQAVPTIMNGDFSAGFTGWTVASGAAPVFVSNGGALVGPDYAVIGSGEDPAPLGLTASQLEDAVGLPVGFLSSAFFTAGGAFPDGFSGSALFQDVSDPTSDTFFIDADSVFLTNEIAGGPDYVGVVFTDPVTRQFLDGSFIPITFVPTTGNPFDGFIDSSIAIPLASPFLSFTTANVRMSFIALNGFDNQLASGLAIDNIILTPAGFGPTTPELHVQGMLTPLALALGLLLLGERRRRHGGR